MAKRIYFNRYEGKKLPNNTVLITRPGIYGNPYSVKEYGREKALELFEVYLDKKIKSGFNLSPLKGMDVACICRLGEKCHGDILLDRIDKLDDND